MLVSPLSFLNQHVPLTNVDQPTSPSPSAPIADSPNKSCSFRDDTDSTDTSSDQPTTSGGDADGSS